MNKYVEAIGRITKESGEVISNALKTIESRVHKVDLSFIDVDPKGYTLNEFIEELSPIWRDLSKEDKFKTAKEVAGNYQIVRFFALMEGLNK